MLKYIPFMNCIFVLIMLGIGLVMLGCEEPKSAAQPKFAEGEMVYQAITYQKGQVNYVRCSYKQCVYRVRFPVVSEQTASHIIGSGGKIKVNAYSEDYYYEYEILKQYEVPKINRK